ncbi:hypothetical protein TNCV_3123281 [Trichonephila clavipes]|nr:hypothetical protein TNCV_3123281 [Trichonephila clavipes]
MMQAGWRTSQGWITTFFPFHHTIHLPSGCHSSRPCLKRFKNVPEVIQAGIEFNVSRLMKNTNEAHFWLNGYVNKQNCRIWSEANPQVYVETPLHPEKLTVWCALWAGGILLQKR